MAGRLQDEVAVITGGASGMGRATVLCCLDEGVRAENEAPGPFANLAGTMMSSTGEASTFGPIGDAGGEA